MCYFAKLDRGTVKPVKWGVADEHLDQVKSFGVKKFEDFTWKHMLDFYSCADCGQCSDNCPANAVRTTAVAAILHHQGAGLLFPALSGVWKIERNIQPLDRQHLSPRTRSGPAPPAAPAKKNARCWWSTSTRSWICGEA